MSNGKILVVDDEQIVLTAFQIELEQEGYDVTTASTGKEAIGLALKQSFDIIFTDLVMPEMNGTQLCRQIKKISPQTEVVLFSGSPYEVSLQQEEFMQAGGRDEMLRKPLEENVLAKVTGNLMKELAYKRIFIQGGSDGAPKNTGR